MRAVVQSDRSFADASDPTYENLALALALEAVSTGLAGNATFQTVYKLLATAGLTIPATDGAGYGLNVGGWRAFVADPTTYLADLMQQYAGHGTHLEMVGEILQCMISLPPQQVSPGSDREGDARL